MPQQASGYARTTVLLRERLHTRSIMPAHFAAACMLSCAAASAPAGTLVVPEEVPDATPALLACAAVQQGDG
jgi:hypothetical protein